MDKTTCLIVTVLVATSTALLAGMYCNYNIPKMCAEKAVVVLNGVPYRCTFEEVKE